jgi:hypothetical protein
MELVCKPGITFEELELEGDRFRQWLSESNSTSFLKGRQHLFD